MCDLGCGSGALGLLLLEREPSLALTGVERDPAAAAVADRNFRENGVEGRVCTGDLRDPELLPAGGFDLAVSNPPWFREGGGASGGSARMEHTCTLDELCAAAGRLVRNGGRFALVHRPERLADLLEALRSHGLEPKRLRLVQHRADAPPSAVLAEAVRQGRPGLEILPVLLRTP
ncbi:tRNA1(Val) (adenine(37)-N6)-methyltransferase [Intestinimonas sp.]|uniref:tRNA1(Val) (adenine(37)-N6)-methyltransferase n=1 Tax=Intestinimonas TaxID=1392389 RepID=UPI003AADD619